ncbi:alpha/beta fold hydrolase [Paenibacillus daejeonensis]|uniref:alpha/beta fold hydrolase n=1 Tax=Paenibacillus daejeonensis TaxID=135193 RepID=UPI00037FB79C|nr:alpha/beta fold hydrolase [Paenibacillus daejeonensis]
MTHPIKEREFSCTRDGLTIRGNEFLPKGHNLPVLIMSHGFGGNATHLTEYGRTFASWGYAAYSFDFCGGCAGGAGRSDGETTAMTVRTEVEDLLAVLDYVKSLPHLDASRITLVGFSQGGFVSALAAAQRADDIASLILVYPALCIPDHARAGALGGASYDVGAVPAVIQCGGMPIGKVFHDTVVDMDPYAEIAAYRGPVLLMHGTADIVVPYTYSEKAKEAYAPGQCHLQLMIGAGHAFTEQQTASARIAMREFLLGHQEILTIQVQITGSEVRKEEGAMRQTAVYFTGTSESSFFQGEILPGAEDLQEYNGDQLVQLRADYTLEGTDRDGERCRIHIINQNRGGEWKPTVTTDSQALAFLNDADLTAALEFHSDGLTVRIYSSV